MSKHNTFLATRLAVIAALGGLLFGYDTAVISGAVGAIDANFITPRGLSEAAASSLSGWAISCALFGCIIGAAIAGPAANAIGRRGGLLIAAALFVVSSVGAAYPELGIAKPGGLGVGALTPFILYRVIGGIGIGIASMLSPLYIAEIAPAASRGRLVTFQQVAIVVGMILVYFVNWAIAAQGDRAWQLSTGWRLMLLSGVLPAALFLILLLTAPDTPRWFVLKGRAEAARAVLLRLTTSEETERTLAEIEETLVSKAEPLFHFGARVVVVGIVLSVLQQFIGINAVLYYAPLMFQNMGASTNSALLQTILVGAANVGFTLLALVTVDRLGRRPLLIAGAAVMAASMLALGVLFNLHALGAWALIAVMAYIGGFAFSWGPVTWVLLSEIFPNAIKGRALGIAVAAQWIANLFVSWSFKVLDGDSALNARFNHGFSYYIYALMSLAAGLFVIRWVPETKGRRLEAIQDLWTGDAPVSSNPTAPSRRTS